MDFAAAESPLKSKQLGRNRSATLSKPSPTLFAMFPDYAGLVWVRSARTRSSLTRSIAYVVDGRNELIPLQILTQSDCIVAQLLFKHTASEHKEAVARYVAGLFSTKGKFFETFERLLRAELEDQAEDSSIGAPPRAMLRL